MTSQLASRHSTATSSKSLIDDLLSVTKMPGQRTTAPHSAEFLRARKEVISREYNDVVKHVASTREGSWETWQTGPECCHSTRARNLVNTRCFKICILTMITANALFIGVATQVTTYVTLQQFDERQGPVGDVVTLLPAWISIMDSSFTVFFLGELILRIVALGRDFFAVGDLKWNLFDTALVATSVADFVLSAMYLDLSFVRVLRVLRLTRTLRMVRLVRAAAFFRTLRLMLLAIVTSSMPLIWAFVCVMGIIYVFGVVFQQGATEYISMAAMDDTSVGPLRVWFSSMPQTVLTLFMSVTGGVSWWEVISPLLEVHAVYGILFVCFISMMVLAALNIITGIFVNDALELTKADHDVMVQARVAQTAQNLIHLQNLFRSMDKDQSDTITLVEFQEGLRRESVRVEFSKVGIEVPDADAFFCLLDTDGSNQLEIDEFVMGCLRLRGTANAVAYESAMQRMEVMLKTSMSVQSDVKRRLKKIESLISNLDQRFEDI